MRKKVEEANTKKNSISISDIKATCQVIYLLSMATDSSYIRLARSCKMISALFEQT